MAKATDGRTPRVIGAGFGRTGTASLKRALETLGLGPCHHMEEVIKAPAEVPTWEAAARGEKVDWTRFLRGWGAAVDFPAALYYRELMEAFPDAKVILTTRPAEAWYQSMRTTIVPTLTRFPITLVAPWLPYVSGPARVMGPTKIKRDLLDRFAEKQHVLDAFHAWSEEVKRTVPEDRLLSYEVKDGWGPLCAFLEVPVPDVPFPRVNDAAEFQRRTLVLTILCWTILLSPLALLLALVAWLT